MLNRERWYFVAALKKDSSDQSEKFYSLFGFVGRCLALEKEGRQF